MITFTTSKSMVDFGPAIAAPPVTSAPTADTKSPSPGSDQTEAESSKAHQHSNNKYNLASVKADAAHHWPAIINRVAGIDDDYLTTEHRDCPRCVGDDRWRVFDDFAETGGAVCNQCGKFGDGLALLQWYLGIGFLEAVRLVAEFLGTPPETARGGQGQSPPPRAASPKNEPLSDADANLRHKVYSGLLAFCMLPDDVRQALRQRGLSDSEIDHRQYGYVGPKVDEKHLKDLANSVGGFKELAKVPGMMVDHRTNKSEYRWVINAWDSLLIPIRDESGRIIAIKKRLDNPTEKGGRYHFLSKPKGKTDWPSSGSPCHIPLLSASVPVDPHTLRVTEGPLKADIATALTGILTIGVGGAGQWKTAIPIIESISPKRLLIAFDADGAINTDVSKAISGLYCTFAGGAK